MLSRPTCFVCLCAHSWWFCGTDFISLPLIYLLSMNPIHCSCILFFCAACLSDPPEFSPDQPTEVQVLEDDMAVIPLLVSANPEEVSCIWLHRREKLVKGDLGLCDGSINQVLVELSQQVSTQLCHSGSE